MNAILTVFLVLSFISVYNFKEWTSSTTEASIIGLFMAIGFPIVGTAAFALLVFILATLKRLVFT